MTILDTRIPRTFHRFDAPGAPPIDEPALASAPLPLVILGEPGSGKTEVMALLAASAGYRPLTAQQLLRVRTVREGTVLAIDGLDQLTVRGEFDGLHTVLGCLADLNNPNFVISCRSSDWENAAGVAEIAHDYRRTPTVLVLQPFSSEQSVEFLAARVGQDAAVAFVDRCLTAKLASLLGNPLTLGLLAALAERDAKIPTTKGALLEAATACLWSEENPGHRGSGLSKRPAQEALLAAGAFAAALLLTGAESVSALPPTHTDEGELRVSEVEILPDATDSREVLGSRLFRVISDGSFAPVHRVIAEFIGAKYIASLLSEGLSPRRVFSLIRQGGTVPASLRGLNAWIPFHARGAASKPAVDADPIGVMIYGDTHELNAAQVQYLLGSLEELSDTDPHIRAGNWANAVPRGLAREELIDEFRRVLAPSGRPHLTTLVQDMVVGSNLEVRLRGWLQACALNGERSYAERSRAMSALQRTDPSGIPELLDSLMSELSESSTQLAVEALTATQCRGATDKFVAKAVLGFGGVETSYGKPSSDWRRIVGVAYFLARSIPGSRAAAILDEIVDGVDGEHGFGLPCRFDLASFVTRAALAAFEFQIPTGDRVWRWLTAAEAWSAWSPDKQLDSMFAENDRLRREIQAAALRGRPPKRTLGAAAMDLVRPFESLALSFDDVAAHLEWMAEGDDRERIVSEVETLLRLCRSAAGLPPQILAVARSLPHLAELVDELSEPVIPPPPSRYREERELRRGAEERERLTRISDFEEHLEDLRRGDLRWVGPAADAYLGVGTKNRREMRPRQRLEGVVGPIAASMAVLGFEQVLISADLPGVDEIISLQQEDRFFVVMRAAMVGAAVRHESGDGFGDLDLRVVQSLWCTVHSQGFLLEHSSELLSDLEKLIDADPEFALKHWRGLIEPQLKSDNELVTGLRRLLRAERPRRVVSTLGTEWLLRLPMRIETEAAIVDGLVRVGALEELRQLLESPRLSQRWGGPSGLLWASVPLVVDAPIDAAVVTSLRARAEATPEFVWQVRDRLDTIESRSSPSPAASGHLGWAIRVLRTRWEQVDFPQSSAGVNNRWDAARVVQRLIVRLGRSVTDAARTELSALAAVADDYADLIRHEAAKQAKLLAERKYEIPTMDSFVAIASGRLPRSPADLQACILDALNDLQDRIRGSETNTVDVFYSADGTHRDENYCRDRIVELIRPSIPTAAWLPTEPRMPFGNWADYGLGCGGSFVPVEVKGQWHRELWTAYESQLRDKYTVDYRAQEFGVYLVLWFGVGIPLPKPPTGTRNPNSALEMRSTLTELVGQDHPCLKVFVLDLER